jgi:hypothetical protein
VTEAGRTRRRLSRTFSRSRWSDYARVLEGALDHGYTAVSLEQFVVDGPTAPRQLVLRHDVDQAARSVRPMLAIEAGLGLEATWYFRWRTARAPEIEAALAAGHSVGLHYETLTRAVLEAAARGQAADPAALLEPCRAELVEEIATFARRFGPVRSIAAHGDTRAAGVRNGDLVADRDPAEFGVEFDANYGLRRHDLACWLTDRSAAEGRWKDGIDPHALFAEGASPVLCLTHPNNWTAGGRLWLARLAHSVGRTGDRPPERALARL